MQIEYEATFINVDKDDVHQRLIATGAVLVKPEFLQRRIIFDLPPGKRHGREKIDELAASVPGAGS